MPTYYEQDKFLTNYFRDVQFKRLQMTADQALEIQLQKLVDMESLIRIEDWLPYLTDGAPPGYQLDLHRRVHAALAKRYNSAHRGGQAGTD